jgi:alpha-1,2-mannosyltransferase
VLGLGVLVCTVRDAAVYPVLAAAGVVVLLVSPSYYPHYAALVAPPLAITVGVAASRLVVLLPPRPALRVGAVSALLLALVVFNVRQASQHAGTAFPAAALQLAAARVHGCVTTDDPTLLPAMNVLSRDLRAGCAVWPDVNGITDDADLLLVGGRVVPRPRNSRWQHDILAYLRSGSAVIVDRPSTGLDAASRAILNHGPVLVGSGRWVLRAVSH